MAKQAVARTIDLDPIDRLEDKIKLLVDMVSRLRTEQQKAADDNQRLLRDIELLRAQLSDAEMTGAELAALREEREVIRGRVTEMLTQLEAL